MQVHHRLVSILRRVRQDVATLLDKEAINAACREESYTWKDRLLNPANTVHLFILQILNENTSLNDLPHKSGGSFTGSAFCKARAASSGSLPTLASWPGGHAPASLQR
jgi:hypothetical protein